MDHNFLIQTAFSQLQDNGFADDQYSLIILSNPYFAKILVSENTK